MLYNLKLIVKASLLLPLIYSCNRIDYLTPNEISIEKTVVLAHRASGDTPGYQRNSLKAAIYGFTTLDGIEVDVAISKDHGLWLTHDSKVKSIDKYFINVPDEDIANIKDDHGNPYYDKLEDVLAYMETTKDDNFISLDVKYPFEIITNKTHKVVAKKISDMVNQYHLQGHVYIESNSIGFLKKIKNENNQLDTYYMCFGNYEKGVNTASQNKFTGISFAYGRDDELISESVELAHQLGVKVLVYTVNDAMINEVYPLNVDIIETDNMDFYDIVNQQ